MSCLHNKLKSVKNPVLVSKVKNKGHFNFKNDTDLPTNPAPRSRVCLPQEDAGAQAKNCSTLFSHTFKRFLV